MDLSSSSVKWNISGGLFPSANLVWKSLNSSKKGCASASIAVILFEGSYYKSWKTRLIASLGVLGGNKDSYIEGLTLTTSL